MWTPALPLDGASVEAFLVGVLVGSVAYTIIHRAFFSPIANVPGPKLAGLTSWYECYYDMVHKGQYVFKIKEMHQKYGPIVRIAPNEISISDPDFVDTIYAPGPGHKRDKDFQKNKSLGVNSSVGGSIAHDLHRNRRDALNPFFSRRSISRLNPELAAKVQQLEDIFSRAGASGEVLNLSDVYYAFSNDIIHKYCFGNSEDLLHDMQLASSRRQNIVQVLSRTHFNLHFGWVRNLMQSLPPRIGARVTPPGVQDIIAFRRALGRQISSILSARSSSPDDNTPSIFTYLRDSPDLPPPEKSPARLLDEAVLLIMAGTYSPMLSLIVAHYHLTARPEIMAELRAELRAHPQSVDPEQLQQLPYLSAVIQEAHRLTFGLTGRNARVCPTEAVTYTCAEPPAAAGSKSQTQKTYTIPPGVSLSASTLLLHTDESLFPDPWRFDPQRWITTGGDGGEEELELVRRRRRAMMSFMPGTTRGCLGMHLADAEMAVVVAAMARWDVRLYETTAEDVGFLHDYHVMSPKLDSKGVRVEVVGRAGGM